MSTPNSIERTLELYQEFYAEVSEKRKSGGKITISDIDDDMVPLAEKFVALIQYAMDKFGQDPCTREDLVNMMVRTDREEITLDDLTSIPQGLIPMLLFKTILKFKNLHIAVMSTRIKPVFVRFAARYSPLIPK